MITPYSQSKFIRKNITNSVGETFSVLFLVTLVNGEVKAQIISAKQISSIPRLTGEVNENASHYLGGFCDKGVCDSKHTSTFISDLSPYIELFFFNSQPTRAPSQR